MDHVELILLFLLVAVAALTALARAVNAPYPIALVTAQVLRCVFRHVMADDLLSVTVSLVAGYAAPCPRRSSACRT